MTFEAYFLQCNICFKYVSSIFHLRKSKIYIFSFHWIYNDFYVISSHKTITLNFLMKMYFWTPYWLVKLKNTCSLLLLFQSFSNFVFNLMESTIVSKSNLSKNWIYLCFCEKLFLSKLDFFHQFLLYKIPCFHPIRFEEKKH